MTARAPRPAAGADAVPMLTPGGSPGFLLWRVTLAWQREVTRALAPLGLTHVQFVLLASATWLAEYGGRPAPSQRELAGHAHTDPMMTSTVLRALEQQGMVTRAVDTGDARVRRVVLTAQGSARAREAIVLVEAVDRDFFAQVPDQQQVFDVLGALVPADPG